MFYGYYNYYYDPTYILVIIGLLLTFWASYNVRGSFNKYKGYRNSLGISGVEAARRLLDINGLYDVKIEHVGGELSDFYDPTKRLLCLSDMVYDSNSISAIGVAAHEVGHALQHAYGYMPIRIRSAMVPTVNFASKLCWPLVFIGFLFNSKMSLMFIYMGIVMFLAVVLFHIVTLPVEIDASRRAIRALKENSLISYDEEKMVRKVLTAAALTYVSSALFSILQLIRIILLARGRRDD